MAPPPPLRRRKSKWLGANMRATSVCPLVAQLPRSFVRYANTRTGRAPATFGPLDWLTKKFLWPLMCKHIRTHTHTQLTRVVKKNEQVCNQTARHSHTNGQSVIFLANCFHKTRRHLCARRRRRFPPQARQTQLVVCVCESAKWPTCVGLIVVVVGGCCCTMAAILSAPAKRAPFSSFSLSLARYFSIIESNTSLANGTRK